MSKTTSHNNNERSHRANVDQVDDITEKLEATGIRAEDTAGTRYGICKWFNVAKGWGFITPNDGGVEVFVHQSVIQMNGFRSLAEQEEVEFECKVTGRGLEATRVSGTQGNDCHGSTFRPRTKRRFRRIRCYNCGEFANHIASKCELGPQPKSCHFCKQMDHLLSDCPLKLTQTVAVDAANPSRKAQESGNSITTANTAKASNSNASTHTNT